MGDVKKRYVALAVFAGLGLAAARHHVLRSVFPPEFQGEFGADLPH